MFSANCFNVMIVSPSDVTKEREIARQLLLEWNALNSEAAGIVLQPIGWDINAFPSSGEHPQKILNSQLLDRADILVGIFWTRIGTATESHISGSVEEIENHIARDKPAMLYFSNAPVVPDSIDGNQYKSLKKYKESIKDKALYREYTNIEDFEKTFRNHINLIVNQIKGDRGEKTISSNEQAEESESDRLIGMLSENEQMLIKEAAQDSSGNILRIYSFNGLSVTTNGKSFGSEKRDPKVEAEIEEALNNLEQYGLIYTNSYKREVFRVTAKGYRVAELLNL